MNLLDFYNTFDPTPFSKSDKETTHNYISEYYNNEFSPLENSKFHLIEIGIAQGNSAKLWREYFQFAKITVIDNMVQTTPEDINKLNNVIGLSIIQSDAYNKEILNFFQDNSVDYLIDDGPHTLNSQKLCVDLYYSKLKKGGKIIIEDVDGKNLNSLLSYIKNLKLKHKLIDLRSSKNRYDNIIIEIIKE